MSTVIDHPGIFRLSSEDYHRDVVVVPSLAAHTAHTILTKSPFHAWYEHPRLNPGYTPKESGNFDLGAAAHALILEGEDRMQVIRAKDYKSNEAKAAREAARESGRHPVLEARYPDVLAMREAFLRAMRACADLKGVDLEKCDTERSLVWKTRGVWKRARLDAPTVDGRIILDLKTTDGSANPETWIRTMLNMGAHIQARHYIEGHVHTGGDEDVKFIFGVQESVPPYATSFIGLPPEFIDFANAQYMEAENIWRDCMESGRWPAYPSRVCWADVPTWARMAWENRTPIQGDAGGMEAMYGDIRREKQEVH